MSALVGPSWKTLNYGKTCISKEDLSLPPPQREKPFVMLAMPLGLIGATWGPVNVPFNGGGTLPHGKIPVTQSAELRNQRFIELGKKLQNAREQLALTQKETADFLHVSLSSIQKMEQGDVAAPFVRHLEKYQTFIDLYCLLKQAFKKSRYARTAMLRSSLSAFGDNSPFEYAVKTPNGYLDVLAVLKKMYE